MNSESINNEIFNSWKRNFKTEVANFEKEIITQFHKTFDELDRTYQDKYLSLIDEKNKKISQLEGKFTKIQQLMNEFTGNKNQQQHMDIEQKKSIPEWRTTSKKQQIIIIDNEDISIKLEEERLPRFDQKKLNQNQREQRDVRIEIEKSTQRIQKFQLIQNQSQYSDHQIDQSSRQRLRLRSTLKPLLQPKRNHLMWRVSLQPNFTKLNYIEYQPNNRRYSFSQVNIDYLQNYDLNQVGSVKIQRQEMTDGTFDSLSRLPWINIVSLQIDENFITNLNPLRNFRFGKLMHLDVSNNKLVVDSAQLLSTTIFDQLIYLTVSFSNGPINQCWEILLRNGMKNFPKLEAIDIYSANNLDEYVKEKIIECMRMKSVEQRSMVMLNKDGRFERYYPQNYEIKIRWIDSKEVFDKQSIEYAEENNKKWIDEVDYKCVPIERHEDEKPNNKAQTSLKGRGRGRPRTNQFRQPQMKNRIIRKYKRPKQ